MANETKFGTFEALIQDASEEIQAICTALRTLIFELHPEAVEVVRLGDRAASFGVGPKKMSEAHTYIMPHKSHVNLGFYYGALLEDKANLLEGTGKKLRHVKVRSIETVNTPSLRNLINAAILDRKTAHAP